MDQVMRFFVIGTRFGHVYNDAFGHEMGRRGSPRAHTLGKRSHEPQDHFIMPPGPLGYHIKFKNYIKHNKTTENQQIP